MKRLVIVKVGGNIIDDEQKLEGFLSDFAEIKGAKVLVHGGGKIATALGDKLGITAQYVDGRRVTDMETRDLVTMVYGGLVNKKIVAQLQSNGCNAIGLSGADGSLLTATKREVKTVDYGYVGDVVSGGVNTDLLNTFFTAGLVPVVAPLTYCVEDGMLNTNADTITQELGKAMASTMDVQLVYCFEKKGLLSDPEDDDSVVSNVNAESYAELRANGIVSGGMIPKMDNAFEALNCNVSSVVIGRADELLELINGNAGTKIK